MLIAALFVSLWLRNKRVRWRIYRQYSSFLSPVTKSDVLSDYGVFAIAKYCWDLLGYRLTLLGDYLLFVLQAASRLFFVGPFVSVLLFANMCLDNRECYQ